MVHVAATVEHDLGDASSLGTLCDELADLGRSRDVAAGLQRATKILLDRRGGRQGATLNVVDDLSIDLLGSNCLQNWWPQEIWI